MPPICPTRPAPAPPCDTSTSPPPYADDPPSYHASNLSINLQAPHETCPDLHRVNPALSILSLNDRKSRQTLQLPTADASTVHLMLLEAFQRLREEVSSTDGLYGIDNRLAILPGSHHVDTAALEMLAQKRWAIFVGCAVDRYSAWWARCIPMRSKGLLTQAELLDKRNAHKETESMLNDNGCPIINKDNLPPLDVLMVWHSHMLNPRSFLEDCSRLGRMCFWSWGMPWKAISDSIEHASFAYSPNDLSRATWMSSTSLEWDSLFGTMHRRIVCFRCEETMDVPLTTSAEELRSHQLDGTANDKPLYVDQFGRGFFDKDFFVHCTACDSITTHEQLRLDRFWKDRELLFKNDVPMPGTLLYLDGRSHLLQPNYGSSPKDHLFPNRLLANRRFEKLLDLSLQSAGQSPSMTYVRDAISIAMESDSLLREANLGTRDYRIHRICTRRMMSRYWDNSSPFALDLVGAVLRQGVFVGKMHGLGWIHSQWVLRTSQRLTVRYGRFMTVLGKSPGLMSVPTLDIDLAWHTHQLSPRAYYGYCMRHAQEVFVDHNDKVADGKLSTAFADTVKRYEKAFGEPYSLCLCWHCELARDLGAGISLNHGQRAKARKALRAETSRSVDGGPLQPADVADMLHLSTHNAVRVGNDDKASGKQQTMQRRHELATHRQLADQRTRNASANAFGAAPRKRTEDDGDPWRPDFAGLADVSINPAALMNVTAGAPGNCAAGTCAGGVAAGSCLGQTGGACGGTGGCAQNNPDMGGVCSGGGCSGGCGGGGGCGGSGGCGS